METILVADDEEAIVEVLACVLDAEGYRVLPAHDGLEAWRLLTQERIDLVISDYMMPGMNGLELCVRSRAEPATAHIPFILISAFAEELVHTSAQAVFGKPFDVTRLVREIRRLLDMQRRNARAAMLLRRARRRRFRYVTDFFPPASRSLAVRSPKRSSKSSSASISTGLIR